MEGRKIDPTFYPVIYGIDDDADWSDEKNWYKANPSLGHTIDIEKVRNAHISAKENPAEENIFRQLRLNQWVKQSTRWMPMDKWDACDESIDIDELRGRECFGGLDLPAPPILQPLCWSFHQGQKKKNSLLFLTSGYRRII